MTIENLQDLYLEELRDIYDAEQQLTKALPQLAKSANNRQLVKAFEDHLKQTQEHVSRLESVFEQNGKKAKGKSCKGMQGLIAEGKEMIKEKADESARDAGLIAAAQRVEHYEIAAYGTVCAYAELLGRKNDLKLLQRTLKEEKDTDAKLTKLAMRVVNVAARAGSAGASSARGDRTAKSRKRDNGSMTKEELYARARELNIPGRSKMGKRELERIVRSR